MNQFKRIACAVIALPALVYGANAPPLVKAPKQSCSNIEWSPEFLKAYPTAPAACRAVIVKDGLKFATFDGKVSKVGHTFVQVEVSDEFNNPISTIAFELGAGGHITLGDKVESVKDLKLGDHLTFWVREGKFGISPTLADQPMTIIKPEAMASN